jgi:hypothetical protein
MIKLDFVMKSSFECPNDEAGDAAFVKVTHTIDGQDAVEEYVSCRLFPSSVSFDLGEIADGETPVSKLTVPMLEFPIARCAEETNDGFQARVELAAVNVVGRYAREEHKVCVKMVPTDIG